MPNPPPGNPGPYDDDPYRTPPYGNDPYGNDPYGHEPTQPYGTDPYGTGPHGNVPGQRPEDRRKPFRRVNVLRLWVGGVMTALVAALAALVAVLLVRGVLDIPVFAPKTNGAFGNATTAGIAGAAALAALVATALLNLLLWAAPGAKTFFGWIVTLATAAMMLVPFTTNAALKTQAASAGISLVIGLTIGFLLTAVGRGSVNGD